MLTSEYTRPLTGKPYYRNAGIIKVYDRNNNRYSVGEIVFERYDDQNYQYIIKPYWNLIKSIPNGIFQGIPGIDMDLRYDTYYRVNMTPEIISMRTPSESRENVRQLMASVGLDYYDRFEWLLRSESKCGDDNLMIVRKYDRTNKALSISEINDINLSPEDTLNIHSLNELSSGRSSIVKYVYQILQSGVRVYITSENRFLEENERVIMLYLLSNMLEGMNNANMSNRKKGRELAKKSGRYTGRKPIEVNEKLLRSVSKDLRTHLISEEEALQKLSMSRSTFYRKLKTLK